MNLPYRLRFRYVTALSTLSVVFALVGYYIQATPDERWLWFFRHDAEALAAVEWSDAKISKQYYEEFIDCFRVVDSTSHTVLFAPHDDERIELIYAPLEAGKSMVFQHYVAKRVRSHWYQIQDPRYNYGSIEESRRMAKAGFRPTAAGRKCELRADYRA